MFCDDPRVVTGGAVRFRRAARMSATLPPTSAPVAPVAGLTLDKRVPNEFTWLATDRCSNAARPYALGNLGVGARTVFTLAD